MKDSSKRFDPRSEREPIAIVGIGCRYPGGVTDPESFWKLLVEERDAVGEIPPERMDVDAYYAPPPVKPGKMVTRWGGYLEGIDTFDAGFFEISPNEAERMDPQQRLLLEVAWEALEDAGLPVESLAGSRTGVFVGAWVSDFEARLFRDPAAVDFHMTLGSGRYALSGRLSYFLDLRGPNLTIDTACSSSLVAVHLACQSLWSGESQLALAGGVNVILQPQITIAYSQMKMMSPEGRCKFGDAEANGYVRSEGAAMLVLKPLSQALQDGDPIYALILATGSNHDGRGSRYMARPAVEGQEELLRTVYAQAGISPMDVVYIEAHGTGTKAGDPVELEALGRVLGAGRPDGDRFAIGSIKTNIGHTEGAAGTAGLIKAALVLKHRQIPASLLVTELNPKIDWEWLHAYIPRKLTPLPDNGKPACAGVNSFGIGGTNAHVVLCEAPRPEPPEPAHAEEAAGWDLLPISARSPEALSALARRYVDLLTRESAPALRDVCYTARVHRSHHSHRLAVVAGDTGEAVEALEHFIQGKEHPALVQGRPDLEQQHRLAFVFPGQGSQWVGMGRDLLEKEPVFHEFIHRFDSAIQPLADWSLLEQLSLEPGQPGYRLDQIDVIQPALVAFEMGLAELWRSWGVEPQAVVGHSLGEVAAAFTAGILSLEDAARVICLRSQLLKRISGKGQMMATGLTLEQAAEIVRPYEDRISIAVSNGPQSTVLAGDPQALEEVMEHLKSQNIFCRLVKVDVASHSPQVEPLLGELVAGLQGLQPQQGHIPFYSTALDRVLDGTELGASYWEQNLRRTVMFASSVSRMLQDNFTIFLELSPHPLLTSAVEDLIHRTGREAFAVPSGRRDEPETITLRAAQGRLYTAGYPLDFARLFPTKGHRVRLPGYPWQRRRYWLPTLDMPASQVDAGPLHPLLGRRLPELASMPDQHIWENRINAAFRRVIREQTGEDHDFAPAEIFDQMALAAAASVFGNNAHTIHQMTVIQPLPLQEEGEREVQVFLSTQEQRTAAFKVYSRSGEGEPWQEHASAALTVGLAPEEWFYELAWVPQPAPQAEADKHNGAAGRWLVLADHGGTGRALAAELEKHGGTSQLIYPSQEWEQALQAGISAASQPLKGCIYLWGLDAFAHPSDSHSLNSLQQITIQPALKAAQVLMSTQEGQTPALWLITRAAASIEPASSNAGSPDPASLVQTLLWGFGRTLALENPQGWGGLVDLDPDFSPQDAAHRLATELFSSDGEDQIVYRDGQRYVARLVPAPASGRALNPVTIRPDATYLITGGLGSIGLSLAEALVARGARHLVLTSRSGLEAGKNEDPRAAAVERLRASGVDVQVVRADSADPAAMEPLFNHLRRSDYPLRGIFHAAGVTISRLVKDLSHPELEQVLKAKVEGAWLLHNLSSGMPLDFFVFFSSGAGLWGSQGFAAYAAANHFLDGLARQRTRAGLPGLSINWGWWSGEGMVTAEVARLFSQAGVRQMPAEQALDALFHLIQIGVPQKVVADIDWQTFKALYEARRARPLLASLNIENEAGAGALPPQDGFLQDLLSAAPSQRREMLLNHLCQQVAGLLGYDSPQRVDIRQGFFKMGMDSLTTVQLRTRLEASLQRPLPPTLAFEYPTIAALNEYLLEQLSASTDRSSGSAPQAIEPAPVSGDGASADEEDLKNLSADELSDLLDGELSLINDLLKGS